MPLPSTTPATAARVSRLDRSVVCGRALASARRQARLTGQDYRRLLSACMAESWRVQRARIAARVALTIRMAQAVADIRADFAAERAEKAASFERYWLSRHPVEAVELPRAA
jgi:hypothetical protein